MSKNETKAPSKAKEILIPTLSLFLIALIATLLLALVNNLTAPKIAEANKASEEEARRTVFSSAATFKENTFDGNTYYIAKDGSGKTIGYVFNTSNKGYGGQDTATVGVDVNGKVTGVVPGDLSNETPGLGQNGSKPKFLQQFVGKSGTISVVKNNPGPNDIQALTSATITSTALTNDVNDALKLYAKIASTGDTITSASEAGGGK